MRFPIRYNNIWIILLLCVLVLISALYFTTKEGFSPEVIISLTTSPKRIAQIKPTLDRIMEQTVLPNAIVLNLPYVFKRNGDKFDTLPEFVTSNPVIKINWCEDIGPATKILPTRKLYSDPETIIISIDDDILYTNTMIETFLKYSAIFPDAVISSSSWYIVTEPPSGVNNNDILPNTYFSEFLEGYSGVLYKKKILDLIDISDEYILQLPKFCFQSDDFILSNELKKNGIPIFIINKKDIVVTPLEYGEGSDALHHGASETSSGNDDNYIKCAKFMNDNNNLFIDHYKKKLATS
jgi:hypothetical protein